MSESTKPTENPAENGNKSKPMLQAVFLIPYLPYNLRYCQKKESYKDFSISFIERGVLSTKGDVNNINNILESEFYYPIFYPVSDLKNKSSSELKSKYGINNEIIFWIQELTEKNTDIKNLTVEAYIFLLEYHFDVFDLISKGLAVSIHDVE